jgi:hypothetical protein
VPSGAKVPYFWIAFDKASSVIVFGLFGQLRAIDSRMIKFSACAPSVILRLRFISTWHNPNFDFKTLEDLGLSREGVEEEYEAPEKHLKPLEAHLTSALEEESRDCGDEDKAIEYAWLISQLGYLKTKRIEINSITKELDDNAAFWDWVVQELRESFPYRDFNRSVDIPVYVMPEPLQKLNDMIEKKGKSILKDRREKLQGQLSNNNIENAFLFDRTNNVEPGYNIKHYDAALAEQSRRIIENDCQINPKLEEIKKLLPPPSKEVEGGS